MSYAKQAGTYQEMEILSASPGDLVVIVYDHLLVSLRRARIAIENDNAELRSTLLARSSDLLSELLSSLDHERGGRIAGELSGLYAFIMGQLVDLGRVPDVAHLDRILGIVVELRDAFAEIAAGGGASISVRA
jgi:flagellar secretion chaperone FliS